MQKTEIEAILQKQREYFATGATLSVDMRIEALRRLQSEVRSREEEINTAIKADLGKSAMESYMCEVGLTLSDLTHMLKHIRSYAKEKTVPTPMAQYVARSYKKPSPYGNVLIMSPWNYPFLLTMGPLVDAVAAGNTAIVKPSAYSPNTSAVMADIVAKVFPPEHVAVVTGGREENSCLLGMKFDYIFFTGSQAVGKEVLRHAAENLTPATLELGGKSPCIVDKSAKIGLAAKRIVFGKYLNLGQTCVAPDYVLCHSSVKDELVKEIKKQIEKQFGKKPLENKDYGKIINKKHFDRVSSLIDPAKVVAGGETDADSLRIAPTVMDNVTWDDAVMGQEIFGPVLPILTFDNYEEDIFAMLEGKAKPLALYIFAEDKAVIKSVTSRCRYGGGCVNDVVIHLATSAMGFGGVGESGMGSYHGRDGFNTFSHFKSIIDKKTWMDLPMRYQPYVKLYDKLIHIFLK